MFHLAMDLGGTQIKLGLLQSGQLLVSRVFPARSGQGLKANLDAIETAVDQLLQEVHQSKEAIEGVAISIPGVVDSIQGRVLSINDKYTDVTTMDLPAWVQQTWKAPLVLENDARMAGVGEWQYGAGQQMDNLVMVTLGTGIGTCAIVDGHLLRGGHHFAGILGGHLSLDMNTIQCNCLAYGCGEALASTWAITAFTQSLPNFNESLLANAVSLDYKTILSAFHEGDSVAAQVIAHSLDIWTAVMFNLISAYDPETIVLGGGIVQGWLDLPRIVKDKLPKTLWINPETIKLTTAQYPEKAALLGGSWLLSQKLKHS